jgi:hypothetical protein
MVKGPYEMHATSSTRTIPATGVRLVTFEII